MTNEPDCPHCLNHRWLIWRQYRDGRKDLEPVPLIMSCQHCNPDGELEPPILEDGEDASHNAT